VCACLCVRAFALSNDLGAPAVDTPGVARRTQVTMRNAVSTPVAGTMGCLFSLLAIWFRNAESWQHPEVFPGGPPTPVLTGPCAA
jgi:hypothetical protein